MRAAAASNTVIKMDDPANSNYIDQTLAEAAAQSILRAQQDRALKSFFNEAQLNQIDNWIAATDLTLGGPEGIRRLVELGPKAKR